MILSNKPVVPRGVIVFKYLNTLSRLNFETEAACCQ